MNSNLREGTENYIFAFGHDPEHHIKFSAEEVYKNDGYEECHNCYTHFKKEELGIVGSPSAGYQEFKEYVCLCGSCTDKEIDRLSHVLGVSSSYRNDSVRLRETVLSFTKANGDKEDIRNAEKIIFLVETKNEQ